MIPCVGPCRKHWVLHMRYVAGRPWWKRRLAIRQVCSIMRVPAGVMPDNFGRKK